MQIWPTGRIAGHGAVSLGLVGLGAAAWFATGTFVALPIAAAAGVAWFVFATRRYFLRRRMATQPFPESWRNVLQQRVKFYRLLDPAGRDRFESDVRIFISEQRFSGAGGIEVDDETKVLVAASAATLGHGMPEFEWPHTRDIVIHAATFDTRYEPDESSTIAGVAHHQGPIIFSGPDLRLGFRRADGHNVGLREMAHVLDLADGAADGVPAGFVADAHWFAVVTDRLKKLRKKHYHGVIDRYGGTNETELFAAAVEAFFERPRALLKSDPELYQMLRKYFRLDPAHLKSLRSNSPPSPD